MLITEDIALVNHLGFTESGGKRKRCQHNSVTKTLRSSHSCIIRGVSSGQPLWFGMVQVTDTLLAPETIVD